MITLREAAQQALKSLRGYRRELGCQQPCDAERALEAALEKHAKDVEWMKQRHANWRLQKELAEQTQERDRQQREYEESRSAALEQPEQPVAWCDIEEDGTIHGLRYWSEPGRREHALYTHPPRREWRGLDKDETMHLMNDTAENYWADEAHIQRFSRALEAKMKERNA
jgi:hypothetical protein